MLAYIKTFCIFVLLTIHFVFSENHINATGFNESYSLRGGLSTVNEGGIIFKEMTGIYKISSKIKPERIYIGSAVNTKNRKSVHFSTLKDNSHYNQKLQRHVNKYRINDLKFEILEVVMFKEDLIMREQFYLDKLNPYFNICKVAGSCLGKKVTSKTKEKMRLNHKGMKGKKHSTDTKRKISQVTQKRERHPMLGKEHSEETKKKISISYWKQKQKTRIGSNNPNWKGGKSKSYLRNLKPKP